MSEDIAAVQQRFRELVAQHWAAVDAGDAKAADRRTDELNDLVARSSDSDTRPILLGLLTQEENPAVRAAAATYVLHLGDEAEAVPVLEELADNDDIGLVAEDADLALLEWRKRQTGTGVDRN